MDASQPPLSSTALKFKYSNLMHSDMEAAIIRVIIKYELKSVASIDHGNTQEQSARGYMFCLCFQYVAPFVLSHRTSCIGSSLHMDAPLNTVSPRGQDKRRSARE